MANRRILSVLRAAESAGGPTDAQLLSRFTAGDEAAFELLVWRHGAKVLAVCRRVLGHEHDAEDAFQATFLALARKARSVARGEAVGAWLCAVAYRAAVRAKARSARRPAGPLPADVPTPRAADGVGEPDLRPVLDEEIGRLPDRYRVPFALCYLDGLTVDEAARCLGRPRGTVGTQLARARARLRERLAARGVAPGAVALAAVLAGGASARPLAGLVVALMQLLRAGDAAVPAPVLTLTEGVLRNMFLAKVTSWAALAAVALATVVGGLAVRTSAAGPAAALPVAAPLAAAAPAPAAGPLRGTVLAADGTPAAGAAVWAARPGSGPLVRRETAADDRGRYALRLEPGEWYVWAAKGIQGGEGMAPDRRIRVAAGRDPAPVPIRLEERGTLRGRLLAAETGDPIPGGTLVTDAGRVVTADAAGRFRVGGLARTHHEAFVVAPGRMRMRVLFDTTARPDTELDVPVPRAARITGRVTDLDGNPIPGAYVGRSTSGHYFAIAGLYQACGDDGRFAYDDAVPPGQPTRLTAAAPGYVPEEQDGVVAPPDGPAPDLWFRLRPNPPAEPDPAAPAGERRRVVSGVVRGPDGRPAAGVLVRWGYRPVVGAVEDRTGADGRYRLVVPDADDYLAVLPAAAAAQFPTVLAGGDRALDIDLAPGTTARGVVTDGAGRPIAGVQVLTIAPSPDPRVANPVWLTETTARTDDRGRFEVKGVPDHARFDFLKPGLTGLRNQDLRTGGVENTVIIRSGGAIVGRAVGRDGAAIRSFRVLVGFPRDRRPGDTLAGFSATYTGIGVRFTTPDGRFVLTGVGAGSVYRVSVVADGHGEAVADRVTAVEADRAADVEPVEIKARPPARLRVRAVAAGGRPVVGAAVALVNGDPSLDRSFAWGYDDANWNDMARGRTGADGWVEFPALGFGEATVLVQAAGYARARVGWRDGRAELAAELAPEAVVVGTVRDAAGRPVPSCYVNLSGGGDQIAARVRPDAGGRFRVGGLPAGSWEVRVRGPDGRSEIGSRQIELKAGETHELVIAASAK